MHKKDKNKHTIVDKELLIIFLLVLILGIIYYFVKNQLAFLNFFYLPVVLGAFFFGKKHGTYSALLSVLLIVLMAYFVPETFIDDGNIVINKWINIVIWGSFLILTGYTMGFLYEKQKNYTYELNNTYKGIITMLSIVIDSVDKYTQNHAYRVSKYSEILARAMKLNEKEVDDIRTAALLHDIGKIGVSEKILNKISKLSERERKEMNSHTKNAEGLLSPIGGRILDILPLIINHHEKYDGSGYNSLMGDSIPLGARIIAVADVYDALTTDRPYRKALSPIEGRNEIIKGAGSHFDPNVVKYFEKVFPEFLNIMDDAPQIDAA
ncbi:MAG: HD-GYP domain-containing protein [Candidatus Schekmanbacteria bacterium]|nr:MAG: HD-GYP domain-containing protein [Candidatus Schekmanbacteria bacterium]